MARRIYLHVGTPKTGTTFLQSVLWANKDLLADQGLLLPLGQVRDHFHLSLIGRDATTELERVSPRARTAWDRMMEQVGEWNKDVLISHELFAVASAERAAWSVNQLTTVSDEVHPIITARDLARQVPAEWQQSIKHGRTHTLKEFYRLLQQHDPSVLFWRVQDLPVLLRDWSQGLPDDHVHLVTVPPAGGQRDLLFKRFGRTVGIDPDSVDQSISRPNESLGVEEIETLRRINVHAPRQGGKPVRQMMVRQVLAETILAERPGAKKFTPPQAEHPWVVERGTAMVEELRALPYDVVGDLDDLLPPAQPLVGPVPDDVDDHAVAAVAVQTVSAVLYRTHEIESRHLAEQVADLQKQLAQRTKRVETLEQRLKAAWAAYERERDLPVWRRAGRRVRDAGQRIRGTDAEVQPGSQAQR